MCKFAVGSIDRSPFFDESENGSNLFRHDGVHDRTRGGVDERADMEATVPPPVHTIIGDLPQLARPPVREPRTDGVVDCREDQLFDIGGDSRRERTRQPQTAFPRTTASSIACALIASVNWPIS